MEEDEDLRQFNAHCRFISPQYCTYCFKPTSHRFQYIKSADNQKDQKVSIDAWANEN